MMKKPYFKILIGFSILLLISSVAYFVLIDKSFFGIIREVEGISSYVSIVFTGDAIPHKEVRGIGKSGYSSILRFVEKEIAADLFFYNLETTVLNKPKPPKPFYFSVEPSFVDDLYHNKFTNFTIANNHMLDFGESGHAETIEHAKNFSSVGYKENDKIVTKVINVGSMKIGFIGFTTKVNKLHKKSVLQNYAYYLSVTEDLKKVLEELNAVSDIIVCAVHWGNEYEELPNDFQKELAYSLIDNGVDIVWGHHPHVIQPFEIYNRKLILYSNGNLLSSQAMTYTHENSGSYHKNYFYSRNSPIIKISVNKETKNLIGIELFPYFQFNNFHIKKNNRYEMFLYNSMTLLNSHVPDLKSLNDEAAYKVLKWSIENSSDSIKNSVEFLKKTFFSLYPDEVQTNKASFEYSFKLTDESSASKADDAVALEVSGQ